MIATIRPLAGGTSARSCRATVAPIPGVICAVLALVLGTVGLCTQGANRLWTVAGVIAGVIAIACTVSGLPVSLFPDTSTPKNL